MSEELVTSRPMLPSIRSAFILVGMLAAFMSPLVDSSAAPKHQQLSRKDRTRLEALCEAYRAAWIANDQNAVLKTFIPDAVLLPHHGHPPVVGTAAIKSFWWPSDSPPATVTRFRTTTDEVGGSHDMGYAWGTFELGFVYADSGRTRAVSNFGTYLMIMRRQSDGAWRITHRMWDDPLAQFR